jgi:CDP-diacylglycerol--glycerol-3-phosphate 3-phosphatidyltransferase
MHPVASVYDFKPKFQTLLRPWCARLARAGVTPNQVTVAALMLSLAEGAAIAVTHGARWTLILLPVALFVRMALNAIDGMLAREFNQKSRLGAVLNELGDVVSDAALYLPFAVIPGVSPIAVVAIVILAITGEMAGVVAIQVGAGRRYDGPFGKSDRAVFFAIFAVVVAAGIWPGRFSDPVLWIAAAAGALTIVNRVRAALRESPAR